MIDKISKARVGCRSVVYLVRCASITRWMAQRSRPGLLVFHLIYPLFICAGCWLVNMETLHPTKLVKLSIGDHIYHHHPPTARGSPSLRTRGLDVISHFNFAKFRTASPSLSPRCPTWKAIGQTTKSPRVVSISIIYYSTAVVSFLVFYYGAEISSIFLLALNLGEILLNHLKIVRIHYTFLLFISFCIHTYL